MKFISQITVGGETREISPNQIPFRVNGINMYTTLFKENYYLNPSTKEKEYGLLPNFAPMYLGDIDIREGYFSALSVLENGAHPLMGIAIAGYRALDGNYIGIGLIPYLKTYDNSVSVHERSDAYLGNLCFSPSGSIGIPIGSGMKVDDYGNIDVDFKFFKENMSPNSCACPVVLPGNSGGPLTKYLNVPMNTYLFGFGNDGVYLRIDSKPIAISDDLDISLGYTKEYGLCLSINRK